MTSFTGVSLHLCGYLFGASCHALMHLATEPWLSRSIELWVISKQMGRKNRSQPSALSNRPCTWWIVVKQWSGHRILWTWDSSTHLQCTEQTASDRPCINRVSRKANDRMPGILDRRSRRESRRQTQSTCQAVQVERCCHDSMPHLCRVPDITVEFKNGRRFAL